MRIPAFPIIASFALVAAPAFAQTSNMTGGRLSDDSTSSRLPPDTVVTLDTQQRLKQSLEQSGFARSSFRRSAPARSFASPSVVERKLIHTVSKNNTHSFIG